MSGNMDNDRSVTTNKMYPIDLAPQKITIVKSVTNSEVKMAHLIPGQPKASASGQLGTHGSPASGIMRTGLTQIISPNPSSQPQMILSGLPILQGTQIVSQGSQHGSPQIISQSQILTPGGLLSPGTQIISQGTQLSAPTSNSNAVTSVSSSMGGPVLNVSNQLASGASNLVVNSSVRTLQPTVRVLPTLPHQHNRSATVLSTVNVSSASNMLVNKGVSVGVTSHVPRGLAAGASLALRPVTPSSAIQPASNQNITANKLSGAWGGSVGTVGTGAPRARALVYGRTRASLAPVSAHQPHSAVVTLSTSTVLNSTGVISGAGRGAPRASAAAPRPLPLLQRNYQPAKVVGVSSVGVRGVVGNSAPTQLYYEVPRAATPTHGPNITPTIQQSHTQNIGQSHAGNVGQNHVANVGPTHAPRPLTPYAHGTQTHHQPTQVNMGNVTLGESRSTVSIQTAPTLARPTILRKRDVDGSPTKPTISYQLDNSTSTGAGAGTGWEDVPCGSGGSTTMSASSSPPRDDEHETTRKKPRKQLLSNEVRHCEFQTEEPPPSPPPVNIKPPKRPQLSTSYVCGWRGTALHFARPADVRRREVKPRDIVAIASQKHVLASAEGWKVHHLTAQMDDLMSLEADVGSQLAGLLRTLESASGKALAALQPHSHTLLELLKGNIQRSKIVCEGIQEAREDILRVFTHRKSVSDILTRQADKRCFRKHRSQS